LHACRSTLEDPTLLRFVTEKMMIQHTVEKQTVIYGIFVNKDKLLLIFFIICDSDQTNQLRQIKHLISQVKPVPG